MAFAILKLSYTVSGDSLLTGGICGTGFFIDSRTAVTANHVLNEETFAPNAGFRNALVLAISRIGSVRRIEREATSQHPEIDTTIITFQHPLPNIQIYKPALASHVDGLSVCGIGHIGNCMPSVDAEWQGAELMIRSANLTTVTKDKSGYVKHAFRITVNANDIKMHGIWGFELSFGSQVGMSGGPVVDSSTGKVLGMLSLGLPADSNTKTETFAVSIDEIWKRRS